VEKERIEEVHFGPVWFIPGENQGKYPFCHSLYIEDAGILIDPASDRTRLARLRDENRVNAVWLSHVHEDHFMHLDLFDDLPLWVSEKEVVPLSDIDLFLDWYGMDYGEYRAYWRQMIQEQFHFKPRKPAGFLQGGQILDLGVQTVEVISTPGHTPGHLGFLFREIGILFIGDYDLAPFGPYYGDAHSSIEETIESVLRLKQIPANILISSHEKGVFQNTQMPLWDDYLNIISKREQRLLELLKKPRTMREIIEARIVYGKPREPKAFFDLGEQAIMKKHLERLIRSGAVVQKEDQYVRKE